MAAARKPVTAFTPTPAQMEGQEDQGPFVHPAVAASPEAMTYAMGAQRRLQQRAPMNKYQEPRPGEPPSIPPLEAQAQPGMTMQQQAAMYGQPAEQRVAQAAQGDSIIDGVPGAGFQHPRAQPNPMHLGLMPTDLLAPEAQQDPNFRQGQGAMYAVNQPQMAMKYGIIRGQQRIPPQALMANTGQHPQMGEPARPGQRPMSDTIRDLQAVAQMQKAPEGFPKDDADAEQQVAESTAGASQNLGKAHTEEEKKEIQDAIAAMDDFDYDRLRQRMDRDLLNNPEQQKIIEERLKPLDLGELIVKDRVTQAVPIVPRKFEITFQSMTGDEDLALKRLLMQESKSVEVTDRYLLDKFSLMSMAVGVIAINANPAPNHLDTKGEFDEKLFWKKFAWLLKRGIHVLASIGTNHTWFEMRVRKLLVAERVKNG